MFRLQAPFRLSVTNSVGNTGNGTRIDANLAWSRSIPAGDVVNTIELMDRRLPAAVPNLATDCNVTLTINGKTSAAAVLAD